MWQSVIIGGRVAASVAPQKDSRVALAEWQADVVFGKGLGGGARTGEVFEIGELAALQGVVKFPVRIKCATLSWNALSQGLDEVEEVAAAS